MEGFDSLQTLIGRDTSLSRMDSQFTFGVFDSDLPMFTFTNDLLEEWPRERSDGDSFDSPFEPLPLPEPAPQTQETDNQCQEIEQPAFTFLPAEARGTISAAARDEMNKWIIDHMKHPFLTKEEEEYFMAKYAITRRQVKTAFNNRRQRIVVPVRAAVQRDLEKQFLSQLTAIGIVLPFPCHGAQGRTP
jgi:hypothetical protein